MIKYHVRAWHKNGCDGASYYLFDKAKNLFDFYMKQKEHYYNILFTVTGENLLDVSVIAEYRE